MEPRPDRHRLKWEPEPLALQELDRWFAGDDSTADLVKHNPHRRSVYALCPAPGAAPTYFLKDDHPHGIRDVAKTLLRPRVRREYRAGRALVERGIPVAEPLACAWRGTRGILVLAAIPQARDSLDVWREVRDTPHRQAFLNALGDFLHRLIAGQVYHPDMHLGNILVSGPNEAPAFYLVDLYGCQLPRVLSTVQRARMLTIFTTLADDLSSEETRQLLGRVVPQEDASTVWEQLLEARIRDTRQRWRGRRRKILQDGSRVHVARTGDGMWRWREDWDRRIPEAAVNAHRNLVFNDPEGLLKRDTKRNLSKVAVAGEYYVVKEWKAPGPWGRFAADHRAWVFNWRLELSGFRVPPFLGWLRRPDGHAYIVMPFIPGRTFDAELLAVLDDEAKVNALLTALRELLESLYRWKILHLDMKLQNVMVSAWRDDAPVLTLIDNDAVRFGKRISAADRQRNCTEMLESIIPQVEPVRPVVERFLQSLERTSE